MLNRTPEKSALIFYHADHEASARGFVEEALQYRQLYLNFYMLPLPGKFDNKTALDSNLNDLFKSAGITYSNTDCFLIHRKHTIARADNKNKNKSKYDGFDIEIKTCAKKFNRHSVATTYEYFSGEDRDPKLVRNLQKHHRYTSSQDFRHGNMAQHGLRKERTLGGRLKTKRIGLAFFNINHVCENPPYNYLLLAEMQTYKPNYKILDETDRCNYRTAILKEIESRKNKAEPIIFSAEHDYPDPKNIAEKMGNFFHAYVHSGLINKRSHKKIAEHLANEFYLAKEFSDEEAWDLELCLDYLHQCMSEYPEPINPKGTFNGLKLEIFNLMHDRDNWQTGEHLNERLDDQFASLKSLKDKFPEQKNYIDNIYSELTKLAGSGKQKTIILKVLNAAIQSIKHGNEENFQQLYRLSAEAGAMTAFYPLILNGMFLFNKQPIQEMSDELIQNIRANRLEKK